jgi:magnesium chelatase accessory protein
MQTTPSHPAVWRWPHAGHSRFVGAAGLRWHVQVWGDGPVALLLHGGGGATHSWRHLAPLLADRFTVIAPDLPGHGFTEAPEPAGLSLPGMARRIAALLAVLQSPPDLVVGHAAGAAIAARMCLDGTAAPQALVCLNGALLPMPGTPQHLFGPAARLLTRLPLLPQLVAWQAARQGVVRRLIRASGSRLDEQGIALYARVLRNSGHVAATLDMMAQWDLTALQRDLPRLRPAVTLVVGADDRAVPPSEAQRVRRVLPAARIVRVARAGHLVHEERPQDVAHIVRTAAGLPKAGGRP